MKTREVEPLWREAIPDREPWRRGREAIIIISAIIQLSTRGKGRRPRVRANDISPRLRESRSGISGGTFQRDAEAFVSPSVHQSDRFGFGRCSERWPCRRNLPNEIRSLSSRGSWHGEGAGHFPRGSGVGVGSDLWKRIGLEDRAYQLELLRRFFASRCIAGHSFSAYQSVR